MKKHILASISILGLLLSATQGKPACCAEKEDSAEAVGSVYQLNAKWTNQHGKEVSLTDFKGKPVLLTMGYASCDFACPRLAADLMAIERALTDEEKKGINIVFASIDPDRDTPEKLTEFLGQYHVDQTRWSALRGTQDAVLELSVTIGTRYRKLENNNFAHSNRIVLLSPTGEIAHVQEGLGTDPAEMLAALRKLISPADSKPDAKK